MSLVPRSWTMIWAVVPKIFDLKVFLKASHDAERPDQGGHAEGNSGDRDEGVERYGALSAFGPQDIAGQ